MPSADVSRALAADAGAVGRLLLAAVEDQWFERKSARIGARKLAEAMVGFANADGGVIIIGLRGGVVEGTRHLLRHRNELMRTALDFTQPTVRVEVTAVACMNRQDQPDELLVFDIAPATTVHATLRDEVLLRVGDETRRLTFPQRRELLYDRGQAAFE